MFEVSLVTTHLLVMSIFQARPERCHVRSQTGYIFSFLVRFKGFMHPSCLSAVQVFLLALKPILLILGTFQLPQWLEWLHIPSQIKFLLFQESTQNHTLIYPKDRSSPIILFRELPYPHGSFSFLKVAMWNAISSSFPSVETLHHKTMFRVVELLDFNNNV